MSEEAALNKGLLATLYPYTLAILRITSGFMFWQHGLRKFGYLGGNVAEFPALAWFAGVMEMIGGPMIALGIFTKPLAFLLSGEMAVAYFRAHAPRSFWPILNNGEDAALYCFIFLFLWTAGSGALSVDRILAKKLGPKWWL
jgi:putative oxidoreductase